jgi:hypothetical protein
MQSETKKQSFIGIWSGSIVVACLALVLGFASTGYGDIILGNWESSDSNDGWGPGGDDPNAILIPDSNIGVTLGHGSLKLKPAAQKVPSGAYDAYWRLQWSGSPLDLTDVSLQFDVTMIVSEWPTSPWTKIADKIAINSDGPSGWKEYSNLAVATNRNTGAPASLEWGTWDPLVADSNRTITLDVSDYDATGATWMQIAVSVQDNDVVNGGNFYFDNFRLVTPAMIVSKCTVTAGKTQYMEDGDYNDMKDTFTVSGTVALPTDVNDINAVVVAITSMTDDYVVYTKTLSDFNATTVNKKHKYTHTGKLIKGQEGTITSLTLDFAKGKFALTAKNIDLTGLTCPFELKFTMGKYELNGHANETVVNGPKKLIPTRLMRTYKDTLIVNKAKAKHNSKKALSDTLSVTGDIAVKDMDLDTNEPNLVTKDVVLTWGDQNGTPTKTLTIPGNANPAHASFKASKKGHVYKCSKVHPAEDLSSSVAAQFDLDQCTFTVSVSKASSVFAGPADPNFSVSFDTPNGEFYQAVNVNRVTGRSW